MSDTISLKELAPKLGVSIKTIQRRESTWGLTLCVCALTVRPKLYYLKKVNVQLLKRNVISEPI